MVRHRQIHAQSDLRTFDWLYEREEYWPMADANAYKIPLETSNS
jgi:hypothetical protein